MTPGARIAAAAGVLDRILAGEPAEVALTRWARASRFAGSGDRAAVRDHVYDALRRRRSLAARAGAADAAAAGAGGPAPAAGPLTGRQLMIGLVAAGGQDPDRVFSGEGHAPARLTVDERAAMLRGETATLAEPVRLDVQDWQLPLFRETLGDRTAAALDRMRGRATAFARVNLALCERGEAIRRLAADGIAAEAHPLAESAVALGDGAPRLRQSGAFRDGWVELQDAAGQATCALIPLADGARMLDFCAGGGGKSLATAALAARDRRRLEIVAHDADPGRMADFPVRARRARLADCAPPVTIELMGLSDLRRVDPFDLVLVDAPCSGSGTWARTPDAKWRMKDADLRSQVARQAGILDLAQSLARTDGGVLVYMTCSLFAPENGGQVQAFLARHAGWQLRGERQFDPLEGGDGFYVAILERGFA